MYGRQGTSSNTPPWLVRAEVTIRHGTPVTSESGQVPIVPVSTSVPSASSSGSFGFQRGNILFTSTPPPRPAPGSFTIPRSGSSGNDETTSSRGRATNVSDSGYNSEQFSPHSYSSLPSRRPSQQYNRRCKSTCSIVLSAAGVGDNAKNETSDKGSVNEPSKHLFDDSWRHRSSHQHIFSRYQFSTVPEVCEECTEGNTSSAFSTHFCSRVQDTVTSKTTAISKDASSQTTDVESRASSSAVMKGSKVRRKAATGLYNSDEQKKKKQESPSPSTPTGTISSSGPPGDSEKSDSSAKDDSLKRKSRTVHIDVYCTGSDDDGSTESSSENECDTPLTVFENPDVRVSHTQAPTEVLPRGFQDENAFLKRASERRCASFKQAPMRMPSLASSKGYESDDVLSSLYPSQFSSYSALRDLDSAPWSAASSNAAIPFDYESTIATSSKDTLSDIDSLINSRTSLTPCDSFEYASTSDRDRIKRMEEIWAKTGRDRNKTWRSPQIERKYLLENKKMREYLQKHEIGWSSEDSGEDSDESAAVGWSFVSKDEAQRVIKKNSTIRRTSKNNIGSVGNTVSNVTDLEAGRKTSRDDRSDSTTRSDCIPHPYPLRDHIGPFGSNSPSPLPSKVPSRVTSPFTTPQGEKTDHIIKASIFGKVVNAFRKPGHHIGPSKNPSCSCEHCRRHFEDNDPRSRSQSISEFERRTGFRLQNERKIVRPIPKNPRH